MMTEVSDEEQEFVAVDEALVDRGAIVASHHEAQTRGATAAEEQNELQVSTHDEEQPDEMNDVILEAVCSYPQMQEGEETPLESDADVTALNEDDNELQVLRHNSNLAREGAAVDESLEKDSESPVTAVAPKWYQRHMRWLLVASILGALLVGGIVTAIVLATGTKAPEIDNSLPVIRCAEVSYTTSNTLIPLCSNGIDPVNTTWLGDVLALWRFVPNTFRFMSLGAP